MIKIDVEGAELNVINGLRPYLLQHAPKVVMEFLSETRGNKGHKQAAQLLKEWGYSPFRIMANGMLEPCNDLSAYVKETEQGSDNIVFVKECGEVRRKK